MNLCVGVDIGATKTHIRVVIDKKCIAEKIYSSPQWRVFDWQKDALCLKLLIDEMYLQGDIISLVVGANGCDEQAECEAFRRALQQHFKCLIRVVNDSELIPPAQGIFDGIGIVCGTGAIAVTRLTNGEMLAAGGWGWVIGDEGSAAGLMREAGKLTCLHLDLGGRDDDPLIAMLCEVFSLNSPVKIGTAIHTSGTSANLGRHAPIIFAAKEKGSALAAQVLDEGAQALVDLVKRLLKRGATAHHVVAGGSVIANQPAYANLFLSHFNRAFGDKLEAHICYSPPVMGACALASSMAHGIS